MRRAIIVLAIGLAACRDHAPVLASNVGQAAINRRRSAATEPTTPVGFDSAMWQDPSCGVDTTYAHSQPGPLIREFVLRNDSLGFLAGGATRTINGLAGRKSVPEARAARTAPSWCGATALIPSPPARTPPGTSYGTTQWA